MGWVRHFHVYGELGLGPKISHGLKIIMYYGELIGSGQITLLLSWVESWRVGLDWVWKNGPMSMSALRYLSSAYNHDTLLHWLKHRFGINDGVTKWPSSTSKFTQGYSPMQHSVWFCFKAVLSLVHFSKSITQYKMASFLVKHNTSSHLNADDT